MSPTSRRNFLAQAGSSALAAAAGRPLTPHAPAFAPLTFKGGDLEIAAAGDPGGPGAEVRLLPDETLPHTYRALVLRDGRLEGVQMVGARKDFDSWSQRLGSPYP